MGSNPTLSAIHEFYESRRSPEARITAGFFVSVVFVFDRQEPMKADTNAGIFAGKPSYQQNSIPAL